MDLQLRLVRSLIPRVTGVRRFASEGTRRLPAPVLLILALFTLVLRWTMLPGLHGVLEVITVGFLLVTILAARCTEGPRAAGLVLAAAGLVTVHVMLQDHVPSLHLEPLALLRLEILAALLVPVVGVLAGEAARRLTTPGGPLPGAAPAVAVLGLGTLARVAGVLLLQGEPVDAALVHYALRWDLATVLWAVGAGVLAMAVLLQLRTRATPRLRRNLVPLLLTVLALTLVGADAATALTAKAHAPEPTLRVGFHAGDLRNLPADGDPGHRLAHLEVAWGRVEPEAGAREWNRTDAQVRWAEEHGWNLILLVSSYPPRWLSSAHPDAVMVDQRGEPFQWADEDPRAPRDRVWQMSFHHPGVQAQRHAFLQDAIRRYAPSPSVEVVAVENEPMYPVDANPWRLGSYDPWTARAFRAHLQAEYEGNLTRLNAAEGTRIAHWHEVHPPHHRREPLWDAWLAFREDALTTHVQDLLDTARNATDKPLTVKLMMHFLSRYATTRTGLTDPVLQAMAEGSDVVSVDLYPVSAADLHRSLAYTEDLAQGKPIMVTEFNLALGPNMPTSGARMARLLSVLDGRADAVILFTVDDHHLYGVQGWSTNPGLAGVAYFRAAHGSEVIVPALHLLVADLLAFQHIPQIATVAIHGANITPTQAALGTLLLVPIPVLSRRGVRTVRGLKLLALALALRPLWPGA